MRLVLAFIDLTARAAWLVAPCLTAVFWSSTNHKFRTELKSRLHSSRMIADAYTR